MRKRWRYALSILLIVVSLWIAWDTNSEVYASDDLAVILQEDTESFNESVEATETVESGIDIKSE